MEEIIERIVKKAKESSVSFLLGSGISINSGIPMVGTVKDNNIVPGIETYILSKLGFSFGEISKFINTIPFETFFEVLIDNGLDMKTFNKVFESEPTCFHKTIARFAQIGITNSIATTNFDECIEKALYELNVGYDIRISNRKRKKKKRGVIIRKFHGSIDDTQNLIISIKRIANKVGYDGRKRDVDSFIKDSSCIIVCGYSCSDIFDLTPIFQSFKTCEGKKIIYIRHMEDCGFEIIDDKNNSDYSKIYNMFGNFDLTIIRSNTNHFMNMLSKGFKVVPEREERYDTNWKQVIDECLNGFSLYQKHKTCGNLYFKIHENTKSIDFLYKAYNITDRESEKIACLRSIAWTYINEKKYSKAMDVLLPFSNDCQEKINEHYVHYANIFSCLGICYTILKPDVAEDYYLKSLALCEEYQLKREEGYVLINLAELYDEFHDINKAISITKRALKVMHKEGYIDTVGICHSNLAFYYYTKRKYQIAQKNIFKAIEIASKLGENSLNNRLVIRNAIEIQQFIQQKLDSIREFKKLIDNDNSLSDKANCNYLAGELFRMSGQTGKAVKYWKKAKKQYDDLNMKSLFGDVNEKRLKEYTAKLLPQNRLVDKRTNGNKILES